jgi:AcrR family transcriptional regulator
MTTDPRVMRSRAAILDACADLISEQGLTGVTIEAVAARSGAAKTTIYRHWPSRAALLIEAFGVCSGAPAPGEDTGSAREDLRQVLGSLARKLGDGDWVAAMGSLIDAAARDPELARLHAATIAERRRPLTDALARAAGRGELPADLDVDEAAALLAGPLFYRAMVAREPVTPGFVDAVVDAALPALRARPEGRGRGPAG